MADISLYVYNYGYTQVGRQFSAFIRATGGWPPYAFEILTPATFPPGLTFNNQVGGITGIPTQAGTFTFTARAFCGDYGSNVQLFTRWGDTELTITITGDAAAPTFSIAFDSVRAKTGEAFSAAVTATGTVTEPAVYSATGLPPGMSINASTGVISGEPTTPGVYEVVITLTDSAVDPVSITRTIEVSDIGGAYTDPFGYTPGPGPAVDSEAEEGMLRATQLRRSARQGVGTKVMMFGGGEVTPGHAPVFDATGALVDGGASLVTKIIGTTFDGGGSALSAGLTAFIGVKAACTITRWRILAVGGTATIKVWLHASGALPSASDSINTSGVSIASGDDTEWQTDLSDFLSPDIGEDSVVGMNLFAASGVTQVVFEMEVRL